MKKVLVGLLMVIPLIIVGAVLLITEVILLTPVISVSGVEIVDEYQIEQTNIEVENFFDNMNYQFFAKVSPKKANNKNVIWSIEQGELYTPEFEGEIATVDNNGKVTIHSTGTFDLICTSEDGGLSARCSFTVNSDVATSAFIVYNGKKSTEITNSSISLTTDEIIKLDACARPTDVKIKEIQWESNNNGIVTVDANGVIYPVKEGTTTVKMSLKSEDNFSPAPLLTDTINVTVTKGEFNVPYKNFCALSVKDGEGFWKPQILDLTTIGAEGAILQNSLDCELVGNQLRFTKDTGFAVLEKAGKTITVNKYQPGTILFENAVTMNNSTIIIDKIPVTLNCVDAENQNRIENAEYFVADGYEEYATIDENGKITALKQCEEPVMFCASYNGKYCFISLYIKEPVIYFKLKADTLRGIGRERVYGNMWYDNSLELTHTREKLEIEQPKTLSNDRFTWQLNVPESVAVIDELGAITINDIEGEHNITVTITAKESPYKSDKIQRTYSFTVRQGVNITNSREMTAAADAQQYDMFMQNDIRYRNEKIGTTHGDSMMEYQVRIYKNLYGNGQLLYWNHSLGGVYNEQGTDLLAILADNVTVRNLRVQSSSLPESGNISNKTFARVALRVNANNVLVQYCQMENALRNASINGSNVIFDGCVFNNASQFNIQTWCTVENQIITVKNCIFSASAAPAIGLFSGTNEPTKTTRFIIEGFCHIYNWKTSDNMDMIGGEITGKEEYDAIIKKVVSAEIQKPKYDKYWRNAGNGVRYLHAGILCMGFLNECKVTIEGAVEENSFVYMDFKPSELFSIDMSSDDTGLHDGRIYSYGADGPVLPEDTYTLNDATCKMLREGIPEESA